MDDIMRSVMDSVISVNRLTATEMEECNFKSHK
jgi:hypothetical protein